MKGKVTDICISRTAEGWYLYIPIATGKLEFWTEAGKNEHLDSFLDTAMRSKSRRFGEDPISDS